MHSNQEKMVYCINVQTIISIQRHGSIFLENKTIYIYYIPSHLTFSVFVCCCTRLVISNNILYYVFVIEK